MGLETIAKKITPIWRNIFINLSKLKPEKMKWDKIPWISRVNPFSWILSLKDVESNLFVQIIVIFYKWSNLRRKKHTDIWTALKLSMQLTLFVLNIKVFLFHSRVSRRILQDKKKTKQTNKGSEDFCVKTDDWWNLLHCISSNNKTLNTYFLCKCCWTETKMSNFCTKTKESWLNIFWECVHSKNIRKANLSLLL